MIQIDAIAAFSDNYIWLLYDTESREAAVVDPGDPAPVRQAIQQRELTLSTILVTHHHRDHTGGLQDLAEDAPLKIIGPSGGHIPALTQHVGDGDSVSALGLTFTVIAVPGHTRDHIAFFCTPPAADPILFCGDTLFAGGCGRLFEGTPEMMHHSLQRLQALPASTRVYCAHEYTLANLAFAQAVEPDNPSLQQRVDQARSLRAANTPTVPSSLQLELETNPFMRSHIAAVKQAAESHCGSTCAGDVEVFAAVRAWKDSF